MSAAARTLFNARLVFLSSVLVSSAIAASYCLLTRAAVSAATRSAVSRATFWIVAAVATACPPTSAARSAWERRAAAATGLSVAVFLVGAALVAVAAFLAVVFFVAVVFFAGDFLAV